MHLMPQTAHHMMTSEIALLIYATLAYDKPQASPRVFNIQSTYETPSEFLHKHQKMERVIYNHLRSLEASRTRSVIFTRRQWVKNARQMSAELI